MEMIVRLAEARDGFGGKAGHLAALLAGGFEVPDGFAIAPDAPLEGVAAHLVLGLVLVGNAVLHAVIVGRFGIKGNEPPAVFGSCTRGWRWPSFSAGPTRRSPS